MQTVFNKNRGVAIEGMIAYDKAGMVRSKLAEGAGLEYGLGCTLGTDKELQRKAFSAITEKFTGIILHEHTESGLQPVDKDGLSILEQGSIYVKVETAVAPGDAVHVRAIGTVGNPRTGGFRNIADGVNSIDISSVAKWETSAIAGGLAILTINLP